MATSAKKKKKKKTIRDVEIGDHVRETRSSKGKKRCGEVLMILQDNPGDPTLECVEVHPDELTPLEKGSDGMRTFKAKRSKADTPESFFFILDGNIRKEETPVLLSAASAEQLLLQLGTLHSALAQKRKSDIQPTAEGPINNACSG